MILIKAANFPSNISAFIATAENGATFSRYDVRSRTYFEKLEGVYGQIVTLRQVHSADVLRVSSANKYVVNGTDGDGLFTAEANLPLGILTADCYPLLIAGEYCTAALHCGWRGTVKNIIQNAVGMFDTEGDYPKYAFIGAGISYESFQVQQDFIDTVSNLFDPVEYLAKQGDNWYFDLKKYIISQLNRFGIADIETVDGCTLREGRFHSYRRDGSASGRMISVIVRRDDIVIHREGVQ